MGQHRRVAAWDDTCRIETFLSRISPGLFASSLEQAADLLCAQADSASYPQRDGKWVVAHRLWGEGLVWMTGAVVCLCAVPRVKLFTMTGDGWPHNAPRYYQLVPISGHFRHCKALLVLSLLISSAVASSQTFTFTAKKSYSNQFVTF